MSQGPGGVQVKERWEIVADDHWCRMHNVLLSVRMDTVMSFLMSKLMFWCHLRSWVQWWWSLRSSGGKSWVTEGHKVRLRAISPEVHDHLNCFFYTGENIFNCTRSPGVQPPTCRRTLPLTEISPKNILPFLNLRKFTGRSEGGVCLCPGRGAKKKELLLGGQTGQTVIPLQVGVGMFSRWSGGQGPGMVIFLVLKHV